MIRVLIQTANQGTLDAELSKDLQHLLALVSDISKGRFRMLFHVCCV